MEFMIYMLHVMKNSTLKNSKNSEAEMQEINLHQHRCCQKHANGYYPNTRRRY